MSKFNLKVPLAVAALLAGVGYLVFSSISETGVYYRTVSEVLDQASLYNGKSIRISGEVVDGSVDYDQANLLLNFRVRDLEKEGATMKASYKGVRPDAFQDGAEVILEGTYDQYGNRFSTNVLLAKCPSKYVAEEGQQGSHLEKTKW